MKTARVFLPYHKQGDDLARFLEEASVPEALRLHAASLDQAGNILRGIAALVGDAEVEVHANSHYIWVAAEDAVVERLIEADLAVPDDGDEVEADPSDEEKAVL